MQGFAVVLAVGLKGERAVATVDHPAAHQDAGFEHLIGETDFAQRMQPADGKGEVDRPAGVLAMMPRIGPFLVQVDAAAGLAEGAGQQRPGQAGADDCDGGVIEHETGPRLAQLAPRRLSDRRACSPLRR